MSEMIPRKVRIDLYTSVQSNTIPLLDINDFDCNNIDHYHNSVNKSEFMLKFNDLCLCYLLPKFSIFPQKFNLWQNVMIEVENY